MKSHYEGRVIVVVVAAGGDLCSVRHLHCTPLLCTVLLDSTPAPGPQCDTTGTVQVPPQPKKQLQYQ